MKKLLLSILVVFVLLAFIPLNAQLKPEKKIEPEEPKTEPKEKPDAKKYDLKIVYTKGMTFERTYSMKNGGQMEQPMEGKAYDAYEKKQIFKLKNTVLAVKDGMPTEMKVEFIDVKVEGKGQVVLGCV